MNIEKRNSSFELLRLILMFLIVLHHCIVHGCDLSNLSNEQIPSLFKIQELDILIIINMFCICGVNTFILISGFFGIKISKKKIISLFISIIFYTLIFSTVYYITEKRSVLAIRSLFIIAQSKYWFIVDYLFLLPFTPVINKIFSEWSSKKLLIFVICLLIMTSYYGFIWHNNVNYDGYNLFQFITLYSLGRLIKRWNTNLSYYKSLYIYIGASILSAIICIIFVRMNFLVMAWHMTFYNNPLIIISAVALIFLFKTIHFNSKVINYCAKSSLAIYLFQSSPLISDKIYNYINVLIKNEINTYKLICSLIILSFITILCAILVDQIQMLINKKITSRFL